MDQWLRLKVGAAPRECVTLYYFFSFKLLSSARTHDFSRLIDVMAVRKQTLQFIIIKFDYYSFIQKYGRQS